jgi:GxxExxY protein
LPRPAPIPNELDTIGRAVVDSAFRVHKELGPGLLESVYEACLAHELSKRDLKVARQVAVPIIYDGQKLDEGLRIDIVVDDAVVVEVKAVERHLPVFEAQLLSYLKLSGRRLGYLINFNVPLIKDGIKRMVL